MLNNPKLVLEGKTMPGDNTQHMYEDKETPDILIFATMVKVFKWWIKLLQWYLKWLLL